MERDVNKKVSVFLLILLIFLSINFVLVSAEKSGKTVKETAMGIAGTFSNFFSSSGWEQGLLEANIAKIFFFIMIALVIYLVVGSIFKGKVLTPVSIILSVIIAFLATAYITPEEIYSILISYTALGLTLSTLIPIGILLGLSYRAATAREGQVQLIMLQWFAWILFAVYSAYRYIYDFFWGHEGNTTMNIIILITAIASSLIAIFNKQLLSLIINREQEARQTAAEGTVDSAVGGARALERAQQGLSGD